MVRNRVPGSKGQDRLTARNNTTREEWKLDPVTGQWGWKDVANRQTGYDWTFSVPKSISLYLARTEDPLVEKLAHQALAATMDEAETRMQCKVRGKGPDGNPRDHDRLTGEMIYSTFVHRESRPIQGRTCPHWHAHVFVHNATYDPVELRWKAGQFRRLKAEAPWYQEAFHHRLAENLRAAGYGIRRVDNGWELACIGDEEVERFSKRTTQIEAEAKRDHKKLWASARWLAEKTGMDVADAYAMEKARLGGRTREKKSQAMLTKEGQREDWRQQMGAQRWDSLSPELARQIQSTNFLDIELAQQKTLEHVFRNRSVASEVVLASEFLKRGVGVVSMEQAKAFVRDDPRFVQSLLEPGKFTTREILAEEARIRNVAIAGRNHYESLGQGKAWTVTDPNLDAGQLAAVELVMSNRDLAVAIAGKPGAGKSRAIGQASAAIQQATGAKPLVLAPSARAVEAVREAAEAEDAMTVDRLKVDPRLQKEVAGRVLFCDEASFLDNARAEWLLTFARDHHCRLVFWGDPRQHDAVERGTPFADLLEDQTLARADLEKIYRQTNVQLLAAVEDYHARRLEAGFNRLHQAQMIWERETEAEALQQLVEDTISFYKNGQDPLVIALRHSHGDAIAAATRQRLKAEGLLGAQDHSVTRLERVDLTDAQRSDPVCYRPGQIVQFHRLAEGGFKAGKQYEVKRVQAGRVMVQSQDDKEKPLPLHQPKAFQVYRQDILSIAVGERVMVTQNNARRGLYNGDLVKVQKIEGNLLHLDNHRVLDASQGLHLRQGYSVSSQASQGHQCDVTLAFLPASAENQIDAKQMTVTVSRAREQLRIYTDSTAVLREAATRSGDRESAREHTRQAQGKQPETEQAIEPDLQEQLLAVRLEKEIQKALMKHQKILQRNAAHEHHHSPAPPQPKHDQTQERGISMGF